MYSNESNGNHISYAAPGREVIAVFNAGKRKGDNKEKIISIWITNKRPFKSWQKSFFALCIFRGI